MAIGRISRFDEELGKALCDRLGLRLNDTLQDYSAESAGREVWVSMTTMQAVPLDEYNELRVIAADRAQKEKS